MELIETCFLSSVAIYHKSVTLGRWELLQSSPNKDHNTFRTTPQEHWWIWPECPRQFQVNN